jgi:photosystem II stability/assembly factor-like uncharacterized protein
MRKYLVVSFILLISSVAISFCHTYHGVSMASNTLKGWVVTSDTGCIYYTPDCGLTWTNQSFLTPRYFMDVFFINEQKGWIGTDQGFIYYTANGGGSWLIQYMGLTYYINRLLFIDDSCGWAAGAAAAIGRTINGGNDWEQIFLPYPQFAYDTVDINGISFVDREKGWICAGRFPVIWWPGDTWFRGGQGYIVKSINGGVNWQLLLRDTTYDFLDIKMFDTLNGFVVGGNDRTMSATIMKTQNGGVSWQNITIPSQAKYLRSLKFIGNQAWAVGHSGTILHSDNGGNNWALQTSPVDTTLYDIDFSDSLHGLIAGDGCVLYSHNGGNTWNISNVGVKEEIASSSPRNDKVKVFPNPFTNTTTIRYVVPISGQIKLELYNIAGKSIKTLTNDYRKVGTFTAKFLGNKLAKGIYFLRYENAVNQSVIKVIIK